MPKFSDDLANAERLIAQADPNQLAELRYHNAVAGVPLQEQRATAPALGGQTPANMEMIAREERSKAQAWEVEQAQRTRWVNSQDAAIRDLTAGQSPTNQDAIRRTFRAMKPGG